MDKIKALLVKSGCKPELVDQIAESLEKYKTELHETYKNDFAAKIDAAKKVCVEETNAHKRELARRLQIFCETKEAAVEAQLARQSALNESAAQSKLRQISSLVQGLESNGGRNGQATAALDKAKRQLQQLAEDKAKAIEMANRQTAIAEKVLKQNRALTTENAKLRSKSTVAVTEGRNQKPAQGRRLDGARKGGQPVSTRATIIENQDRRPVQTEPTRNANGRFSIEGIAQIIDEDLV